MAKKAILKENVMTAVKRKKVLFYILNMKQFFTKEALQLAIIVDAPTTKRAVDATIQLTRPYPQLTTLGLSGS